MHGRGTIARGRRAAFRVAAISRGPLAAIAAKEPTVRQAFMIQSPERAKETGAWRLFFRRFVRLSSQCHDDTGATLALSGLRLPPPVFFCGFAACLSGCKAAHPWQRPMRPAAFFRQLFAAGTGQGAWRRIRPLSLCRAPLWPAFRVVALYRGPLLVLCFERSSKGMARGAARRKGRPRFPPRCREAKYGCHLPRCFRLAWRSSACRFQSMLQRYPMAA